MATKFNVFTGNFDLTVNPGAGTGDVVGPGLSTDNAIARFSGTGGVNIQNSSILIDDSGAISGITSLSVDASGSIAFGAVTILSDSAGTTTLSNIDALDATTEATIESAIDSLTNLTTVGTISTGTWNGSVIAEAYGGTNQSSYTTGDILYASGANTLSKLAAGSNGEVLTLASGVPSWAAVSGSGNVSNTGTPVNNQLAVWTDATTVEGDAALTFDTTTDTLAIGASGNLNFGAVTILADSAGTTTLSNIDAIDATTEATFEAAIDSLTNLTAVGTIATGTWEATDVGVAHGGTGASTAADARTNLGLAIGTDVQAYDADLAALSALASTGILARTGAATYAERTITGTSNEITVTNGDGVSGAPTLSLPATIDLGGKTSLEIPNSATPTVDADGEIAVDTTVTDFSHGVLKYYGGEELGVVAMPIGEFTTPTDGYVVAYNATNDEFELVAQSGSGSMPPDVKTWEARNLDVSYTPIAPLEEVTTTNVIAKYRAYNYATIEYANCEYHVPPDVNTSGNVKFFIKWKARTVPGSSENVIWAIAHAAVASGEDLDSASFTEVVFSASGTTTTQNTLVVATHTLSLSTAGWAAGDAVFLKVYRKSTDANDTFDTAADENDDALLVEFSMEVDQA